MTNARKHQAVFVTLSVITLLIGRHALYDVFSLSVLDDEYTQILLILPISIAFIFLERRELSKVFQWNFRLAPVLLIAACAFPVWAQLLSTRLTADEQLSMSMFALVLSWIGIFVLCFGALASKIALFPLLFLFGLVPLPRNALNFIISLLQGGSTGAAHALFAAFGVPVVQEGNFLTIPGLMIQVAKECSSIRSSCMLLTTTIVLVQLFLRSPWRKAVVVAFSIPLSVAKNGLRIFTIAMLGTREDPGYLTGRFHRQGGIVFFIIALMCIFALLAICRKGEVVALQSGLESSEEKAARA